MNKEELKDVVITSENFDEYFFDVRKNKPKPGQVLAKFKAVAYFVDSPEKWDVIKLLKMGKAQQAAAVLNRIHCARVPDCYRVCREMSEDLMKMKDEEVAKKEYKFIIEAMYYAYPELVPKDDPHWEVLQVLEYDKEKGQFVSKIDL